VHVNNSQYGAPFWPVQHGHGGSCHPHPKRDTEDSTHVSMSQRAMLSVSGAAESQSPDEVARSVSAALRGTASASIGGTAASNDAVVYDAAMVRKQKASLNIVTQDGDAISIRFRSREGVAVQSGSAGTAQDGSASTDFRLYAFASGRVEIAVQGELDQDELKAIGELVEKVDTLATDFFGGDFEAAFAAASELGFDSSEIASFSLKLSLRESARISTRPALLQPEPAAPPSESSNATSTSSPGATSAPVPGPASTAPSSSAPESTLPPTEPPPTEPAAPGTEPSASSPTPPVTEPAAPAASQSLQEILGSYVRQIMDSLAQTPSSGRIEFSMSWKLRLVATALESPAQSTATTSAGAKLLGATLQDVAASQKA
jgi:cell division septation protein DedD